MTSYRPKIYGASKTTFWRDWLRLRAEVPEIEWTARWPEIIQQRDGRDCIDDPKAAVQAWLDDFTDIQRADAVLLLCPEPEEHLRGALVEAGYALALNKPVYVCGKHADLGTWQHHPMVQRHPLGLPSALDQIMRGSL